LWSNEGCREEFALALEQLRSSCELKWNANDLFVIGREDASWASCGNYITHYVCLKNNSSNNKTKIIVEKLKIAIYQCDEE
jgi:hypothetical protein